MVSRAIGCADPTDAITASVNTLAVAAFIAKNIVVWRVALPMLICTLIGGYWGAHAVQRLTAETARRTVLVFAWTMSLWLLVRSWQ